MVRRNFTNVLLLGVALLLVVNALVFTAHVRAASGVVHVQVVQGKGTVNVDGDVVGFSCVNKGAYTECSIASR